jgi:hypothetical protein
VTSDRLLVVTPNELVQYGDTPDQPKHIPLPDYMDPHHAVETSQGWFVVCHTGVTGRGSMVPNARSAKWTSTAGWSVFTADNAETADPHQLNYPVHLAQDATGHLLVADCNNRRIVLLNLELERMNE